jgi:threonine/homoserine/homoserine lactone efflux protein
MSRQSLAHGMKAGAPVAFGALVLLASVALIVLLAAALLLATMSVV